MFSTKQLNSLVFKILTQEILKDNLRILLCRKLHVCPTNRAYWKMKGFRCSRDGKARDQTLYKTK